MANVHKGGSKKATQVIPVIIGAVLAVGIIAIEIINAPTMPDDFED